MFLKGTESNIKPDKVKAETLGDGSRIVRLADNVKKTARTDIGPEGEESSSEIYVYDEVIFELGADRTETEKDIKDSFADWWTFGSQEETAEPTMEERISAIEDTIMELMG